MNNWIDITRPFDDTLVTWPGRSRPEFRWEKSLAAGHHCNASQWQISAHTGTHMDAPLHFIAGGKSIDQILTEVFIGDSQVVDLTESKSLLVDVAIARQYAGEKRLLIKTAHSTRPITCEYAPHDALMTLEAASCLVEAGLLLLGTDRLSIDDSRGEGHFLHHRLLGGGCVLLEGLWLAEVTAGPYLLFAAPLRLTGTEASPVRALLRRRHNVATHNILRGCE